jgi:hypothetical protein
VGPAQALVVQGALVERQVAVPLEEAQVLPPARLAVRPARLPEQAVLAPAVGGLSTSDGVVKERRAPRVCETNGNRPIIPLAPG